MLSEEEIRHARRLAQQSNYMDIYILTYGTEQEKREVLEMMEEIGEEPPTGIIPPDVLEEMHRDYREYHEQQGGSR